MSDDIRCFIVANLAPAEGEDAILLDYKTEKTDRRNFTKEATEKVTAMTQNNESVLEQTKMGMIFGKTDEDLAYLIFVAPDYPESVAKHMVDKYARAVKSMTDDYMSEDGATINWGAAKKAYAAVCRTLATEYDRYDMYGKLKKTAQVVPELADIYEKAKGTVPPKEDLVPEYSQETSAPSESNDMNLMNSVFKLYEIISDREAWRKLVGYESGDDDDDDDDDE
jgi:hypothetical protein